MKINNCRILVAGGSGFIGTNLLKSLNKKNKNIKSTYFRKFNFKKFSNVNYIKLNLEKKKNCLVACRDVDIVFMCAANSSGASVIQEKPLTHLNPNIIMNLNMLEAAHQCKVKKFIFISSNVVYPLTKNYVKENDAKFKFYPKYYVVGWMKRFLEIVCDIYSNKIINPMQTIIIRPGNLYGPYDKFDDKESKVIPALIKKIIQKKKVIKVWGDGKDVKDFLYIDDFIKILLKIVNKVNYYDIFNIASGKSISINKILNLIIKIRKLNNLDIIYDNSKPTMIPKRFINITKIKKQFGFRPKIDIFNGLVKTINWYKKHQLKL
jgi:GDP-L-fucose synthase